jgi:hypothetical protein
MKMLITAMTLALTASAAMAEARCENPRAEPCRKACAVMGARFALSMREQALEMRAATPKLDLTSFDTDETLVGARRLAYFAGLSLQYIDAMTLPEIRRAVDEYCPSQPR